MICLWDLVTAEASKLPVHDSGWSKPEGLSRGLVRHRRYYSPVNWFFVRRTAVLFMALTSRWRCGRVFGWNYMMCWCNFHQFILICFKESFNMVSLIAGWKKYCTYDLPWSRLITKWHAFVGLYLYIEQIHIVSDAYIYIYIHMYIYMNICVCVHCFTQVPAYLCNYV